MSKLGLTPFLGLRRSLGLGHAHETGGGGPVWRGVGSRANLPERISTTTNLSWGGRSNYYSPIPVRYIRIGIPTFYTIGAPAADVDLTHPIKFQVGIDKAYTRSMNPVPARQVAKFSGEDIGYFDPAIGPYGVLESDIIDLGEELQYFSIFVVMQWADQPEVARSFPRNIKMTNAAGTWFEKTQTGSTTDLIAQGWATTRADMGTETATGGDGFAPYVKALLPAGTKSIGIVGSSSAYGVAENAGVPTTDSYGDVYGTRGYPGKWLNRKLGLPFGSIAKPSDSLAYFAANPANSQRRRALLSWLNPSHIIWQLGQNDVGEQDLTKMLTDLQTSLGLVRASVPGVKIYPTTLTPASNSAVGRWTAADGSDQINGTPTDRPGFGPGLLADTYNENYVRALAGPWADSPGYIETYDHLALDPGGNSFKWKPGIDAIEKYTGDGSHATAAGSELVIEGLGTANPFT